MFCKTKKTGAPQGDCILYKLTSLTKWEYNWFMKNMEDLSKKEPGFNPQDFLKKTGHIREIIEASPEDVKIAEETEKVILQDSKYDGFKGLLIKAIPDYLSGPIILDDFKEHDERRKWRTLISNIEMDAYNFYDRNKIANHSMRQFFSMFTLLSKVKEISSKLKIEISEIEGKVIPAHKYELLSEKEKLEIVDSLTALSRQVCNEIIK